MTMRRRAHNHSFPGGAVRLGPAFILSVATFVAALSIASSGQAQEPAVHAVLFYSPVCPHCHKVMTEDLPPLMEKYGDRLVIAAVDVTTEFGQELYRATVDRFGLSEPRRGVPTLVVGDVVLVGAMEIPARFPDLIESGLSKGGVDWPDVAEIRRALVQRGVEGGDSTATVAVDTAASDTARRTDAVAPGPAAGARADTAARPRGLPDTAAGARVEAPPPHSAETATDTTADTATGGAVAPGGRISVGLPPEPRHLGPVEAFGLDPLGNAAAVVVLLGLLASVFLAVRTVLRGSRPSRALPTWFIPVLSAVGMGVASYLALVEVTGQEAVCGPVGNCNAVQQSSWAFLFGVLPVGMLGQIGYLVMFAAWLAAELGPRRLASLAWKALWVLALVGTLFSAYLTLLEPFVIGATCAWCLTSSIVTALILLVATGRTTPIRRSTELS